MALGQGAGRTFLFNQQQQAIPQQPEQVGTEPQIQPIGDNLRATSGQISDYYQAYGNLEAYAKSMWENHRYDVTRADPSDPDKIKAHDIYLQGAAYVNELKNKLSREARMESAAFQQGLTDPNLVRGDQSGLDTYDQSLDVQMGTTDRVKQINRLSGAYSDKGMVATQNKAIKAKMKIIQDELDEETDPKRRMQLAGEINDIQFAIYDPNIDENQAAAAAKAAAAGNPIKETARPLEIEEAQAGYVDRLKSLRGGDGEIVYSNVVHSPALGKMYLTRKDNGETEEINLRSEDGGRSALNEAHNVGTAGDITQDQLEGLDPKLGTRGTGHERGFPDISKNTFEDANLLTANMHSGSDRRWNAALAEGNLSMIPGTKDDKGIPIKVEELQIIGQATNRGNIWGDIGRSIKSLFTEVVPPATVELAYSYIDEDGDEQQGLKTYDLNKPKRKKEFNDLVLFNAENLGIEVKAASENDVPRKGAYQPSVDSEGKKQIPQWGVVKEDSTKKGDPIPINMPDGQIPPVELIPEPAPTPPEIPLVGSTTAKDSLGNKIPQLPNYEGVIEGSPTADLFIKEMEHKTYKLGAKGFGNYGIKGATTADEIDCSGAICTIKNKQGGKYDLMSKTAQSFRNSAKTKNIQIADAIDGDMIVFDTKGNGKIDHIGFIVVDSAGKKYIAESSDSYNGTTIIPYELRLGDLEKRKKNLKYEIISDKVRG